jgi:deoxyribonuclease-4
MLRIGCHLSSSKGYLAMGKEAVRIGANTFQFFTRNPRGGAVKPLNIEDMQAYNTYAKSNGIEQILAHAPYTLNACAADAGLREFARNVMEEDLMRLSYLPDSMYNFHPGSHVKQGAEVGIRYITDMLNDIIKEDQSTTILLETMAGKGSEVGREFEEIRAIIDKTQLNQHLGVCLDTCHVYDAGYDIVNHLDEVLQEFDQMIGIERLKAVHLNDSKNPFASHKDRHEKIGDGSIGIDAVKRIINHPLLLDKPFYLETPNDIDGYAAEIALLKANYEHGTV